MDPTPQDIPVLDLFSLKGQNALITGASRGIGAACALALAQAGANICLVLRPPQNQDQPQSSDYPLPPAIAHIHSLSLTTQISVVYADLSNPASIKQLFPQALEKMNGEIDILVHCAGVQKRCAAVSFSEEEWDEVLTTNLKSAFLLSQAAGAHMLATRNPLTSKTPGPPKYSCKSIILIASLLSYQGGLTVPAYAASKGGVAQLIKALSNEWSKDGVRVNGIVPGYIKTDMNTALLANPTRLTQINDRIPAGRWGDPADFAGVVVFLASRASLYMCGELVVVDGGWLGR